jgi:hypothetical protein
MKASRSWLVGLLAAACLVLASGTAQAQLVDKCQQGIEKEAVKIQAAILKALQLCKDKYRQTVVKVAKNQSLDITVELPKVTKACDTLLLKTIGGPLTPLGTPPTAVQKTYDKLNKLYTGTPQKCDDASLAALGHLPQGQFGDAWIRWLITAMLKAAYEKQIWIVADTPGIMSALCDANGNGTLEQPGPTGDCPTCCKLTVPPCNKMNCRLAAGSQAVVSLLPEDGGPKSDVNLLLGKEIVSEYCQYPDFIGSDIAVVGNPSRTVDELNVGGNKVCVTQLRAAGFIKCSGVGFGFTGPKNVDLCVDAAKGAGPCNNLGACLPASATSESCPSGGTPGPTCQALSGAALTNDTVVLSTLQIENAGSGNCTGTNGNVVPTVLTTGTVSVKVENYDNNDTGFPGDGTNCNASYTATVAGVPGTNACGAAFLDSADLGGTTLVGGFPALRGPAPSLGDLTTVFQLICEP